MGKGGENQPETRWLHPEGVRLQWKRQRKGSNKMRKAPYRPLTDEELKMTDDELMAWINEQNAKAAQHRTALKAEQEEILKSAYLAGIEQLLTTATPATLDRVWAILSSEALQRLQQH